MELNGALLAKRGRKVLESEIRFEFGKVFHLVDSETILCMINKVSTRFQVYEGVRISEIQHGTNGDMSSWFWISGSTNIADLLTRSASVDFIQPGTEW